MPTLENQTLAHSNAILETLQTWSEQESDVCLISNQGAVIQTHRVYLQLYSPVLNSALRYISSDLIPSIFIPASTSSLVNLIKILSTGVSISEKEEDLLDVVNTAELLGILLKDVQLGTKRTTNIETVQNDEDEIEKFTKKYVQKRRKTSIQCTEKVTSDGDINQDISRRKVEEPKLQPSKETVICSECGMTLASMSKLKRHLVSHTGEKPFSCDVCGSRFARKDKLDNHKNAKHNENYVKHGCFICNKAYGSKWHLSRHMERAHSSEITDTNSIL